jgi:hypothetical protein
MNPRLASATIRPMRPWLERLALSFLIIAAVLAWEAYKGLTGRTPQMGQARINLYLVASVMSIAVGVAGIRSRHRPHD